MVAPDGQQLNVMRDPAVYTPAPNLMRTWIDYLYDMAGASQRRPFRRALVSLICGAVLYSIGLLLAVPIHFASVYVTTPGAYFVVLSFVFVLGRWRSMTQQLAPLSASVRDVFAIPDEEYAATLNTIGQRATNMRWVTLATLVVLGGCWGFIAVIDFIPRGILAGYTVSFPYPFSQTWFTGPDLWVKMLISDLLTAAVVSVAVPILYATIQGMPALILAVRKWPVIPVPAHVSFRLNAVTTYFVLGGLYYAIGVTVALFAMGGRQDPIILTVTVALVFFGVVTVLAPIVLTYHLIKKSQDQLATAVSGAYYSSLFPIAISSPLPTGYGHTEVRGDGYTELRKLQELLDAAGKTKGIESQWRAIAVATVTQSLPLLHLLFPTLIPTVYK